MRNEELCSLSKNSGFIFLMILAMTCFACRDAMNKFLASSIPVSQVLVLVGLIGTIVFFILSFPAKVPLVDSKMKSIAFVLRFFSELISSVFLLVSIVFISLSSASAITQAAPILVAIGGKFFFKEIVTSKKWILILLGFVGVLLIIKPNNGNFNPYFLFAVISVIFLALKDLTTRSISNTLPAISVSFWSFLALFFGGLFCIPFFGSFSFLTGVDYIFLAFAVFFSASGNLFLILATRGGQVSTVTSFRYTRLPIALLIGIFLFNESLDIITLTGCILIITVGIILGKKKYS